MSASYICLHRRFINSRQLAGKKACLTYEQLNIQFHRELDNYDFALLTYSSQVNLILQFVTLTHCYLAPLQIYESRIFCSAVCNFERAKCSSKGPGAF